MSRHVVVAVRLSLVSFRSVSEMHGNTNPRQSRLVGLAVQLIDSSFCLCQKHCTNNFTERRKSGEGKSMREKRVSSESCAAIHPG